MLAGMRVERWAIGMVLMFAIACRSSGDGDLNRLRELEEAELRRVREDAEIENNRQMAAVMVGAAAMDRIVAEDARAKAVDAKRELALAERDAAGKARRPEAERKVSELGRQSDEIYETITAIVRDTEAERARILALPPRCFTRPVPADCKIPPEIEQEIWPAPD